LPQLSLTKNGRKQSSGNGIKLAHRAQLFGGHAAVRGNKQAVGTGVNESQLVRDINQACAAHFSGSSGRGKSVITRRP
jgi:hypothetical protein